MAFASKSGCPMCGIVAKALHSAPNSPALFSAQATGAPLPRIQRLGRPAENGPEILWRDDNFTVYRERANPVSSKGHLVIVFNLHVPSIYMLSSSDVPLLISLRSLAHRFLSTLVPPSSPHSGGSPSTSDGRPISPLTLSSPPFPPTRNPFPSSSTSASTPLALDPSQSNFRVGFITPPWKDSAIPVKDHLHAHAYIAPHDLCGWWRGVAYSPLAWYAVEDLIAEIREETSNNRVKSGYEARSAAPIDSIPDAGARSGTADGQETTDAGLSAYDVESAQPRTSASRAGDTLRTPSALSTPSPPTILTTSHLDLRPLGSGNSSSGGSGSGAPGTGRSMSGKVEREESYSSSSSAGTSFGAPTSLSSRPGSRIGPNDQLLSPIS